MKNKTHTDITGEEAKSFAASENLKKSIWVALVAGGGLLVLAYVIPPGLFATLEMKPEAAAGFALLFSSLSHLRYLNRTLRRYHGAKSGIDPIVNP
jgi:hypothetical protein